MPLKGEKKRIYQQRYMRSYMRKRRMRVKMMLAERYGIPIKMPKVDAEGYVIPDY